MDMLKVALNDQPKLKSCELEGEKYLVVLEEDFSSQQLNEYLVSRGVVLSELTVRKESLETQFLELVK